MRCFKRKSYNYEMNFLRRPESIYEVSIRLNQALAKSDKSAMVLLPYFVSDFRHHLQHSGFKQEAISQEPLDVGCDIVNVWFAGLAEHIAQCNKAPAPQWTELNGRYLSEPVFFGGKRSRKYALAETPSSWRKRLIFSGATTFGVFKSAVAEKA